MRKSITSFQAHGQPVEGERNTGKSETIPGQSISPQELLRRYATGQPLGFKNVTPVYDDDENYEIPEFNKLDKLDRLHFLQENTERVLDAKNNLKLYQREQQLIQQQKEEVENTKKEQKSNPERSDSERKSD